MAEILLNKVLNEEIKRQLFIQWLLRIDQQEPYLPEFNDNKCSQTDFLTYFLNFVHEEIPCHNRYGEAPQKVSTSKRTKSEETPVEKKPTVSASDVNNSLNTSECSSVNYSRITSTPKMYGMQSITNGYFSPISPLYKHQNSFSTPKTQRQGSGPQKSVEKAPALCLGDFIVHKRPSGKKKASRNLLADENCDESSRRIKPTNLSQVQVTGSFRKTENSFNNFENTKEVPVESVYENRSFLAEERLKILSRKNSGDNMLVPTKKIGSLVTCKVEIEPDVALVTNKKCLECLVGIYVATLSHNLVLNVNSEIYFLISLLLGKQMDFNQSFGDDSHVGVGFLSDEDCCEVMNIDRTKVSAAGLFETVHNVVYFAVKCLETQLDVIKYYDKSTLKLLSSNHRLRRFGAVFAGELAEIAEKKPDRILEVIVDDAQTTNVCFNLDTDNRGNFPTDASFHSFRKQRDLFYEILRVWENNRMLPGWSFCVGLGGKIRGLFGLHGDSANFMHFARLFKAQLLSTCGKMEKDEGLSVNQLPFLSSLPNVDADKLSRLKSRLVTKQSSNGINPLPAFTGHQEFYRDFIVTAGNYAFNIHLCNSLISEIIELNDNTFSCTDLEESGSNVDPSTRKAYMASLKSLRVLAKFLGFVESLPYKSDTCSYTENFLVTQINLRQQTKPALDIKQLLLKAVSAKNLILTIPWVTEYIAMLDYVTLRLPYYISVHHILFDLYKNCHPKTPSDSNRYDFNASAIRFTLGWLFELPHFPDSEYFKFRTDPSENFAPTARDNARGNTELKTPDDMNVIDQNILYVCCPYLEEIKKLLSCNVSGSSVTVKHITPVTALQSSGEMAKKRLEQQLEEAFFNGQPVSVRKTVEFVSERVASTCVKHICSVIVPGRKKSSLEEVKKAVAAWRDSGSAASPTKEAARKSALRTKIHQMAQENLDSLRDDCDKEASAIAKEKISPAIDSLMAVDVLPQTRDVCGAHASKICLERVRQWINAHVTLSVFTKDFDGELHRALTLECRGAKEKPVFMLPPGGSAREHDEDSLSAFHLIEKLKVLSVDVLENSGDINDDVVLKLVGDAYVTLNKRCDVNDSARNYTCSLLFDLALLLITHKPEVMSNVDVPRKFVAVWKCLGAKTNGLFKNALCLRNARLLAQSGNAALTWQAFAEFVAFLIEEGALASEDFESQCTGFFKRDWDQVSLRNFSVFLRKFLECHRSYGGTSDLLDFLSDFCSDL